MIGRLTHDLLESEGGAVEQLQGAGDPLEEVHLVPLGPLEARPGDPANLGHGRETIVQLGRVPVRFPRIAPRPVDAETSSCPACTAAVRGSGYKFDRFGSSLPFLVLPLFEFSVLIRAAIGRRREVSERA